MSGQALAVERLRNQTSVGRHPGRDVQALKRGGVGEASFDDPHTRRLPHGPGLSGRGKSRICHIRSLPSWAKRGSITKTRFRSPRGLIARALTHLLSADRASQPLPSAPMTPPSRFEPRDPRLRGLRGDRLEVPWERQCGSRLGRDRRRFDRCLCRILGSDQQLSVVAAAPSRLARSSSLNRWFGAARRCRCFVRPAAS